MSTPSYCDEVYSHLSRFLGSDIRMLRMVGVNTSGSREECTIEYERQDTCRSLSNRIFCGLYDRGAIWINNGQLRGGDIVTPLKISDRKIKEVESVGCKVTENHAYNGVDPKRPNLQVSHIHLECPKGISADALANLLAR